MRSLFLVLAFAVSPCALAQEASREKVAELGETMDIPENSRDGVFFIEGGSHIEIRLDDKYRPAQLTPGEAPAEVDLPLAPLSKTEETLVTLGPVTISNSPGTIAFTVWVSKDQTIVKLQNRTSEPLIYIAGLYKGAPTFENLELTTICATAAGKVGVESWPYAVTGIGIVRILRPPESSDHVCVDPAKSIENPTWYPMQTQ